MKKVIKDLEFAQELEKIEGFTEELPTITIETNQQANSGGSTDNDEDATSDSD